MLVVSSDVEFEFPWSVSLGAERRGRRVRRVGPTGRLRPEPTRAGKVIV